MALSIIKPFVHVEDANGNPYVGAKLYVYLPGTTTLASIYSDSGLSVALANPLSGAYGSDAAGNFPRAYIAAGSYKLRAETSAGVLIWEMDNIDTGLSAGSGALPIASGGTGGITAAAARTNLDVPSNSELADLASDITDIQASLQNIVSAPQGRLTLTSATPVMAAGVSAATSVYYTPYLGNLVPIYDGTQFNTTAFSELTLTLNSNHVLSSIYDIFLFDDNGTIVIGTGPAWNTITAGAGARGTGAGTTELTRSVGGLLTNAYAMTARNGATTYSVNANRGLYVGSMFMDGTNGQISCHTAVGQSRKWGLWNAYNRKTVSLRVVDGTSSWSYTSATIRASQSASANSLTIFAGLAEDIFDLRFTQEVQTNTSSGAAVIGIGYNSLTTTSGKTGHVGILGGVNNIADAVAEHQALPALGINTITALEGGITTATFFGAEASMLLSARWLA
jgi:hypothetical protein